MCVRHKDGQWCSVSWMGFICRHGTGRLQGRYCKIQATDVTRDDGFIGSDWRTLKKTEFALGWLVEWMKWGQSRWEYGVYSVIDDTCMPIVIDDQKARPEKTVERAPVVRIEAAKRIA